MSASSVSDFLFLDDLLEVTFEALDFFDAADAGEVAIEWKTNKTGYTSFREAPIVVGFGSYSNVGGKDCFRFQSIVTNVPGDTDGVIEWRVEVDGGEPLDFVDVSMKVENLV